MFRDKGQMVYSVRETLLQIEEGITVEKVVIASVRQMCLAAVMIAALMEGVGSDFLWVYFLSALTMAGVDVGEMVEFAKTKG